MPTASAIPPSVIELRVSPKRSSTTIETSSESGIETSTISVGERSGPANAGRVLEEHVSQGLGALARDRRANAAPFTGEVAAHRDRRPSRVALELLDEGEIHQPLAGTPK